MGIIWGIIGIILEIIGQKKKNLLDRIIGNFWSIIDLSLIMCQVGSYRTVIR